MHWWTLILLVSISGEHNEYGEGFNDTLALQSVAWLGDGGEIKLWFWFQPAVKICFTTHLKCSIIKKMKLLELTYPVSILSLFMLVSFELNQGCEISEQLNIKTISNTIQVWYHILDFCGYLFTCLTVVSVIAVLSIQLSGTIVNGIWQFKGTVHLNRKILSFSPPPCWWKVDGILVFHKTFLELHSKTALQHYPMQTLKNGFTQLIQHNPSLQKLREPILTG